MPCARAQFQHLPGVVQRPDARERRVQPVDDGLCAALKNDVEIVGLRQRDADVRAERRKAAARFELALIDNVHALMLSKRVTADKNNNSRVALCSSSEGDHK